jgi:DNA-directed RNA polymerase I, II, and III subunit RPABC2
MSDEEKSYASENESGDDSDDEIVRKPLKQDKVILPKGIINVNSDVEDEEDEDEDDLSDKDEEDTGMSSDDEDDSDIENIDESNIPENVFGEIGPKSKSTKKTRGNQQREEVEIQYDMESDDEDDVEDDDEDGEKYLQKFDDFTKQATITQYHPELLQHNHDEIETLCTVVRDSNGHIVDPLHRTVPFLTKYERARILGERAKQIESGAKPLVNVTDEGLIDSYLISCAELAEKKVPFIIKRPLPNGGCEYWKLKDLEFL